MDESSSLRQTYVYVRYICKDSNHLTGQKWVIIKSLGDRTLRVSEQQFLGNILRNNLTLLFGLTEEKIRKPWSQIDIDGRPEGQRDNGRAFPYFIGTTYRMVDISIVQRAYFDWRGAYKGIYSKLRMQRTASFVWSYKIP